MDKKTAILDIENRPKPNSVIDNLMYALETEDWEQYNADLERLLEEQFTETNGDYKRKQ